MDTETATLFDSPLFDIGANLTSDRFNLDRAEIIERAIQHNVNKILVTGTNIDESIKALELAERYPDNLFSTAGIHPHDAKTFNNESLHKLRSLCANKRVKAIGETGLDFNRNFSEPKQQIKSFEQHIELAIELGLPLFLHERDAFKTQYEILRSYRDQLNNAVIHCFTGTKEECFRYLDLDLYIGITGWICDPKRGLSLQAIVKDIPIDRLMIETDAPYLLPKTSPKATVSKKGRNEPCTLPLILETIASYHTSDMRALATASYDNSCRFFKLK